jgi:hypothetical protein
VKAQPNLLGESDQLYKFLFNGNDAAADVLGHQQYSNVCIGIALQSMTLDLRRSFA